MKAVDVFGKEYETKCLSCDILNGNIPTIEGIIFSSKYFIVTQDFSRPIIGFVVIATKRHSATTFASLTQAEQSELSLLITKIENILKSHKICEFFNIYIAEYGAHFHLQILPRYKYMENEKGTIIGNLNLGFSFSKENLNTPSEIKKIKNVDKMLKRELNKQIDN